MLEFLCAKESVQWLLLRNAYLKEFHLARIIRSLLLPPELRVTNIMVFIADTWLEGGIEKLGVNCAFLIISDLDLTSKVDAEHTLNGNCYVDRSTHAPTQLEHEWNGPPLED